MASFRPGPCVVASRGELLDRPESQRAVLADTGPEHFVQPTNLDTVNVPLLFAPLDHAGRALHVHRVGGFREHAHEGRDGAEAVHFQAPRFWSIFT